MASFSGSKSETVGCGLARFSECREDPDELRVLFISLDISRINWARCLEVVGPVMAVVYCWCDWVILDAVDAPKLGGARGALLAERTDASIFRGFSLSKPYCGECNVSYEVQVKCVMLEVCLHFERASAPRGPT